MPSDPKRVQQVLQHIARIRAGDYPTVVDRDGDFRIIERPWQDLGEASRLSTLQGAVDWSGVTNRDPAHILLASIDPPRVSGEHRVKLIDAAVKETPEEELGRYTKEGWEYRGIGIGDGAMPCSR